MTTALDKEEESQLLQTIEMFEVITQSQPQDYQSLEILKEAYSKLGREKEAVTASKRIAQAYMGLGQISLAILEYEMILQRYPEDKEVQEALLKVENKAIGLATPDAETKIVSQSSKIRAAADLDDGRQMMRKIFVDGKVITAPDFDAHWPKPGVGDTVAEPFIQLLADKGLVQIDKSLKLISDKIRMAYLSIDRYDVDADLARSFPKEICRRWCVLPFDKMSKTVLVGTSNPFNKQAVIELEAVTQNRLHWYLVPPMDLVKTIGKLFR